MLLHLHDKLLEATPNGQARLKASREDGDPLPPISRNDPLFKQWVHDQAVVVGDAAPLPTVITALCCLDQRVLQVVLENAVFLCVGTDSAGWTASSRFMDSQGRGRPRLVALGPTADVKTVLHEAAHVWCHSPLKDDPDHMCITVVGESGLMQAISESGHRPQVDDATARAERLCDALAYIWLENQEP